MTVIRMMDASGRRRYAGRRTLCGVVSGLVAAVAIPAFGAQVTDAATGEGASFAVSPGSMAAAIDSTRLQGAPLERGRTAISGHDIATVLAWRFHVGLDEAEKIGHAVIEAARHEALSPMLLLAVIAVESGFDRRALSDAGAVGLMQVLPLQHKDRIRHAAQLWDTDTNVSVGSSILHEYLTATDGDLNGALVRYSGGARGYSARVTNRLNQIEVAFRSRPHAVSANENAPKY